MELIERAEGIATVVQASPYMAILDTSIEGIAMVVPPGMHPD